MGLNLDYAILLQRSGFLTPDKNRILDIGPQNVYFAREDQIREFVASQGQTVSDERLNAEIKHIVQTSVPRSGKWLALFSEVTDLTGIEYDAVDVCPAPKTEILDLNYDALPERMKGYYDVVLNFGTTEHVFNQWNCFEFMHDAARVGGVIYHQVPASGYLDHGYFCYTPLLFKDLARANGYELISLFVTPAGESRLDDLRIDARSGAFETIADLQGDNRIPGFNMNVILKKKAAAPFRCGLEVATANTGAARQVAAAYRGDDAVAADRPRLIAGWRPLKTIKVVRRALQTLGLR